MTVTTEQAEAALKLLQDLQDPDMPQDLPGAVNYMINHSNAGWSKVAEQDKTLVHLTKLGVMMINALKQINTPEANEVIQAVRQSILNYRQGKS